MVQERCGVDFVTYRWIRIPDISRKERLLNLEQANRINIRQFIIFLLALIMSAAFLLPHSANAQGSEKIIRVGWFESAFNITDEFGRRSGYAYEYQQKIAAYTGWTYEYVTGSWVDLLQMLVDGKIDLMADVSYTEDRAEKMLYTSMPMGSEDYYIFVAPDNQEIRIEDLSSFNGKKVGINKGSVQLGFFRNWAEANNIHAEIIELTTTNEESITMLRRGQIDIYVTLNFFGEINSCVPLCKIGSSDFYFVVSLSRPELIPELNAAMSRIQDENYYFNQELYNKYLNYRGANRFITSEEMDWLKEHGKIRVGYQDNYMAFCARDPKTGELTGAMKEYLRVAADSFENVHLDFEAIAFPSAAAAMEAMQKGEIDCMFPANFTYYDGETQGFSITPALMHTDMSAVIRRAEQESFNKNDHIIVAVNAGNPNYDKFLLDYFPDWRAVYYKDTPEGLRAIADGQADCLLISNFRYNNISSLCQKYDLTTISTGVEMDYCFALNRGDTALYSILSKITGIVPPSTVNSALSYYFTEDAKSTLGDLLRQHIGVVIGIPTAVALVFLFLLLRNARMEEKDRAKQELISATEIDEFTGLYSKSYFYEYVDRMYHQNPEMPMDAILLNIVKFHSINAINGRVFGNQVLIELGNAIRSFLAENQGIAGHSESDHFGIYCAHLEDCHTLLDFLQEKLDRMSTNASIRLRMGVMPWQAGMQPIQMFENARVACSKARENLRDHLVIYDDKVREREAFEHRLLNDLQNAVENREFEVYYQPKYDIRCDPPKLVSAEALVRWRHPELGMISPGEFIPLLERNSQISLVDRFVWQEASSQISEWKKKFGVTIPISVNLSRVDVLDLTLEPTLEMLIKEYDLVRSDLKLEVTESACTENAGHFIDVIERLRKKGFEIEMDDFGAGYSSLNMLSSMPIDVLKMDKGFVSNIEHEEKDLNLVELILGIAKKLKIPVIAEGVETEIQLRLLKEMGCELVQGYYFSRPLPVEDFEKNIIKKTLL